MQQVQHVSPTGALHPCSPRPGYLHNEPGATAGLHYRSVSCVVQVSQRLHKIVSNLVLVEVRLNKQTGVSTANIYAWGNTRGNFEEAVSGALGGTAHGSVQVSFHRIFYIPRHLTCGIYFHFFTCQSCGVFFPPPLPAPTPAPSPCVTSGEDVIQRFRIKCAICFKKNSNKKKGIRVIAPFIFCEEDGRVRKDHPA